MKSLIYLEKNKYLFYLKHLFVFLVILFITRNILSQYLSFSDLTPFSFDYKLSLQRFLFVWNTDFTGMFSPASIYLLFRSIFEFISFSNPIFAQNSFVFFFLTISYYSFYFLLRKYKINYFLNYFIPFFYIMNPFFITQMTNGALSFLIFYSIAPFLFILFCDLLSHYNVKKGIIFSIIIALFLVNVHFVFWFLLSFIVCIAVYILFQKITIKNIIFISLHFLLGIIINIISLIPFYIRSHNYLAASYLSTFKHTYSEGFFYNLFRLIGNKGSSQNTFGYFDINIINLLPFIFFIIIILYLFNFKKIKNVDIKIASYVSVITLLMLMAFIFIIKNGYLDSLIINKNMIISSIRNPEKLFFLFTFYFILLLALASNSLFNSIKSKYNMALAVSISLIVFIIFLLQNSIILTGDFGLRNLRGNNNFIDAKYLKIFDEIKKEDENFSILFLPFDYPLQLKTFWQEQIIKTKMGAGDINSSNTISELYENICNNRTNKFDQIAKFINLRYIILDKNPETYSEHKKDDCIVSYFYGTPYIWGNYDFFDKKFISEKKYYEDDNFKIYELNDINYHPHIYMTKEKENIYFNIPFENVEYLKKNPTEYKISLKNLNKKTYLNFSESFHPDWKLRAGKFDWFSVLIQKDYFLPDEFHLKNNANLSTFKIDPEFIKENYPNSYTENPDGSINVELTLYFKPQSYFYLGLIISATTLLSCLVYLVYDFIKRRKIRKLTKKPQTLDTP